MLGMLSTWPTVAKAKAVPMACYLKKAVKTAFSNDRVKGRCYFWWHLEKFMPVSIIDT